MPLTKSKGNMYDWCTHMHSHLRGECPHKCSYCYVQAMERRFNTGRYSGPIHVDSAELAVNYGIGKVIFIEHLNDLFADEVPFVIIDRVLKHVAQYPGNRYVFQTKNPKRISLTERLGNLPFNCMVGTTIESNRWHEGIMGNAPHPLERLDEIGLISRLRQDVETFITVEPILDCDPETLASAIADAQPSFVNIGADSKGHGLPEPSKDTVMRLVDALNKRGVTIRKKSNLERILK